MPLAQLVTWCCQAAGLARKACVVIQASQKASDEPEMSMGVTSSCCCPCCLTYYCCCCCCHADQDCVLLASKAARDQLTSMDSAILDVAPIVPLC